MAKLYHVGRHVIEQAERMQAKLEARVEAFYAGDTDGWGFSTAGYCQTEADTERCQNRAEEIGQALARVTGSAASPVAPWAVIETLKAAAQERDGLDAGVIACREMQQA